MGAARPQRRAKSALDVTFVTNSIEILLSKVARDANKIPVSWQFFEMVV